MLLHLGGAATHKLGRFVVEEGPPFTCHSLKRALTAHFEPLANPDYDQFLLRQARQLPNESVDTFYARLKELARTCTLLDVEDEKVQDTIPHVPESSELQEQVKEALSKRVEKNDKISRKRRAKKRNLRIGDHVLVHKRRSGGKFLLPFEKDPWVVSAINGTMITAKSNHETLTRNISFFKTFRMANGEMERDQIPPQTSLFDDGDEGSVDSCDRSSMLSNPGMVVDEPLRAGQECAGMQGSVVVQNDNQDVPESLSTSSLPPRQGLKHYSLRPRDLSQLV
ncbi:hypothetical protein NDU88_009347 [Pleurodeles waltl]|uniref:Retrotransposon gag domain-containing protein n=1 Tax=Pleurodeles waltl TaxID=8319 RepID=A0AAV7RUY6_PLEWA|nr:hypothetical protein NDU88_009347 [Pleurodeles waltl]